jgi:Mg/Co/Ni transporter MgtE
MRDEMNRLEEVNSQLRQELEGCRLRLTSAQRANSSLAESKQQDELMTKMQSKELERALEEAKEEGARRISETTQFQQMKKIMQSQSAKIRELTRRLQKYEPDAVKEEDDATF